MVRLPLTPEQLAAGRRLGVLFRSARADRDPVRVAAAAGISPETLRKLESGRMPSPSFGTVVGLCAALEMPVDDAVATWLADGVDGDRVDGDRISGGRDERAVG
ncbi:helix-turn-helix domain-containing protein [Gordonia sp. PS3]|uniref:helix-turn-helix domain-containing protein n=1 Tax=Gordonia sp. PS3 TaxID=3248841 RepID=UPI0035C0A144